MDLVKSVTEVPSWKKLFPRRKFHFPWQQIRVHGGNCFFRDGKTFICDESSHVRDGLAKKRDRLADGCFNQKQFRAEKSLDCLKFRKNAGWKLDKNPHRADFQGDGGRFSGSVA